MLIIDVLLVDLIKQTSWVQSSWGHAYKMQYVPTNLINNVLYGTRPIINHQILTYGILSHDSRLIYIVILSANCYIYILNLSLYSSIELLLKQNLQVQPYLEPFPIRE